MSRRASDSGLALAALAAVGMVHSPSLRRATIKRTEENVEKLPPPYVPTMKEPTYPSMFRAGQKVTYLRGKELLKGVVQGVCIHMDKELVTVRRAKGVRTELCIGGKDGSLIVAA